MFFRKLIIAICCFISINLEAKYTTSEWIMKNGLHVVMVKKTPSPVTYFSVWYKCGSVQDEKLKSGVAHFLEHMAFETDNRKFSELLESIGAENNAFTSYNTICFYEIFDKASLSDICENESKRMKFIDINDEAFNSEKGAILEERNTRIDNYPGGIISECLWGNVFNRKACGIEIIGWKHEIESIEKEDLKKYHDKWFAPNNAIIVIVGDFDFESTKKIIESYFQEIPAKKLPKKHKDVINSNITYEIEYKSPKVATTIEYIYQVPALTFKDRLALKLAIATLDQSNQEMNYSLKYNFKIASGSGFGYISDVFACDIVSVYIDCLSIHELKKCETLWKFFKTRLTKNFSEKNMNIIKKRLLVEQAYEHDDISKIGTSIGYKILKNYKLDDILNEREIIQTISKNECCKVLDKVFNKKPIAIMRSYPKEYDRE